MAAKRGEPIAWLRSHIRYEGDECLVWPFGLHSTGYGQVRWKGQSTTASRVMCLMAHGPSPEGKPEVAHSCGNKLCVNPAHLRHASWTENSADKIDHGRENFGERNGQAKLTVEKVRQIIALYQAGQKSQRQIAKMYGVRDTAISRIITGKRWKTALEAGEQVPGAELVLGDDGLMVRTK